MKKLFSLLFASLLCLCVQAQKQGRWFVGGSALMQYSQDVFQFGVEPVGGYEFNRRIALGAGLGMSMAANNGTVVYGVCTPFVRFTPVDRQVFKFDLKLQSDMAFDQELAQMNLGIVPSFRFRLTDHFDLSADVGLFGVQDFYGEWKPALGFNAANASLWLLYRF